MPTDVEDGHSSIKQRLEALKAYKELRKQYDNAVKKAGDSFEEKKSDVSAKLSTVKEKKEALQKKVKSQFERLLDLSRITGGKNTNTILYLKRAFLKTIEKIKPELEKLLITEIINALGCDQQQTYNPQVVYVSLKSIDLRGSLKFDFETDIGKIFYEKLPVSIQSRPFSMNRELYNRIQSNQSYSGDTGQLYNGASGQPLFDIKYVDVNPLTGVGGGWYEVTLVNRVNNLNVVYQFLADYFKSINVLDFVTIMANVMDSLSGAISIQANIGLQQIEDSSKFSLFIQRVLGLCFDNASEIDVNSNAKLDVLGESGQDFFELTEIDLRNIESRISDIQNGVVEFEECDNVKLPVNSAEILSSIVKLFDAGNIVDSADGLTQTMTSNPQWGLNLNATLDFKINYDFLNLLLDGIIRTILAPKILLPFITMYKAVSSTANALLIDTINSYFFFFQKFKSFMINLISKLGGIFVRELVDIIKKDILSLVQSIIADITKEKTRGIMLIIMKLVQFLIIGLQFIDDWRKCRSVLDEILQALDLAVSSFGLRVPPFLLNLSQFLDGYSETRAFIGTIVELQKLGVPTDDMPDGEPNLDVLAKFAQIKAQHAEELENGYIAVYSDVGTYLPTGTVLPMPAYGKKL